MIEFKAECGHTVRAKDDDAGGVVRCSYCGRNTPVPDAREDDLDFLFRDIEPSEVAAGPRRRRPRRGRRFIARRARPRGGFDPFSIIFRMCYAALLIIIVYVLGKSYVLPLFEEGGLSHRVAKRVDRPSERTPERGRGKPARTRGEGLIGANPMGLYIASTPPGATAWFVEEDKVLSKGRFRDAAGAKQVQANGECLRVPDGIYAVEVVLAWNDKSIASRELPYYEEYLDLRRRMLDASDEERVRLLEDFFVPDEARTVFIDQTEDQYFIVRQYRNVVVRNGKSKGVRALFLPKIRRGEDDSFSIGPLVTDYLPKKKSYVFERDRVRDELADFYNVPEPDQVFLVEGLERIGIMPYVAPDGRTWLFKIGIRDGSFGARVIREASE